MLQVKAQEKLEDPDYVDRLTLDSFYDLILQAGYGEDVAQKAANERGWDRLNSGKKL